MLKKRLFAFLSLGCGLGLLVILGCQSHSKKVAESNSPVAGAMQEMAVEVKALVPYLYNAQAFQDPKNAARIKTDLRQFAQKAHQIQPGMNQSRFGQDPMQTYSLEALHVDLDRALEAFDEGRLEYARSAAKAVTSHCFSCHSVSREGQKITWDLSSVSNLELAPAEKVDLFVALRRFDEAAKYLESRLRDPALMQNSPFDYETLLRKYFSLMVRVENDPKRPLKELEKILSEKKMPAYVSEQAESWLVSLKEWNQSQPKAKKDLLVQAGDRLKRGRQLQQYPKDHAGDLEFLRATRLLHDFLRGEPSLSSRASAYFMLGQAYEVLDDLGYWNLHETYFESCIRAVPYTDLAKKCYSRIEASIFLGYSGSSGVHIPESERTRLKTLKDLTL